MQISKNQISTMLEMQDKNNKIINQEWATMGWPFLRAVLVEATEGMEHVGWKWWKKQTPDWPQVQLELVDIWHFILSNEVLRAETLEIAAKNILAELNFNQKSVVFDGNNYIYEDMDLVEKFELMVGLAASRRVDLCLFQSMLGDASMSWSDLIKMYVGKNVLNRFRQANGYKEGSYAKIWNGEEDNVHLAKIMENLPEADIEEFVWGELLICYTNR